MEKNGHDVSLLKIWSNLTPRNPFWWIYGKVLSLWKSSGVHVEPYINNTKV